MVSQFPLGLTSLSPLSGRKSQQDDGDGKVQPLTESQQVKASAILQAMLSSTNSLPPLAPTGAQGKSGEEFNESDSCLLSDASSNVSYYGSQSSLVPPPPPELFNSSRAQSAPRTAATAAGVLPPRPSSTNRPRLSRPTSPVPVEDRQTLGAAPPPRSRTARPMSPLPLAGRKTSDAYALRKTQSAEGRNLTQGGRPGFMGSPRRPLLRAVRFLMPGRNKSGIFRSSRRGPAPEEATALMEGMEQGHNLSSYGSSYDNDEEDAETRAESARQHQATQLRAHKGWGRVTHEVTSGNLLLRTAMQRRSQQEGLLAPSELATLEDHDEDGKERLRQKAQDLIRSGVQFTLPQCMAAMALYIGVAVVAFSFVFDHWTVIDSIYFAIVTFTTIGYGDLVPDSHIGRYFTLIYALSGVACLGIALGVVGSHVVEAQERAVAHTGKLAQTRVMSLFAATDKKEQAIADCTDEHLTEQAEQEKPCPQNPFWQVLQTFGLVSIILVIFACLIANDPGVGASWSVWDALYYATITATTVGYGDLAPQTQQGRLLAIFFIPLAVGAMGHFLSIVAQVILESRRTSFQRQMESHELSLQDLEIMDADGDGDVSRAEFLEFMLM
jgi:voltage-gated potassium channel Kch